MANKWGIPNDVKQRDTKCVYCGVAFSEGNSSRKHKPSWEHIINDLRINGTDNIAHSCISCNASKVAKLLEEWLHSDYSKNKNITKGKVAKVVMEVLINPPKLK